MAGEINRDYRAVEYIKVIGLLKGSFIFMGDLIRELDIPVRVDFMEISSYGNEMESSGNIKILKDLSHDIAGEHVLVAEDIIDTGLTLNHTISLLLSRKPQSLKISSLLVKKQKHHLEYPIDYAGIFMDDVFVVGYGMDSMGYYRNLPYIADFSAP